ncbi:MAG: VWA domain-containing protein [Parachlamydiaceae bacterium]|nr:VWA domain-containing protein [Parachlamydiaceae bacterium]
MIEFAWPYIFLLIFFPWFIYKVVPPVQLNESASLCVPEMSDFAIFQQRTSKALSPPLKIIFLFLIWLALIASAARPQWIGNVVELPQSGRDIMLAVDLSGSMQIKDFKVKGKLSDRLTAVKVIASDFIDRRKGDRIGLILFGSQAYLQTPLTFDLATVKQLLDETVIGLAGTETAMGDAIGLAIKQLRDTPQASRVLILITDGNNNAGELMPEKAAELAAHENLKIHTVAIGSKHQQVQTALGQMTLPSAEIDEKTLKLISEKTGGKYFRAYNTDELVKIYHHIDQLETREEANQSYRPSIEMYKWPLAAALLALGVLMFYEWSIRKFATMRLK